MPPGGSTPPVIPVNLTGNERHSTEPAALAALVRYPGIVGETLAHECRAWGAFGYRYGPGADVARLVAFLLTPIEAKDPE